MSVEHIAHRRNSQRPYHHVSGRSTAVLVFSPKVPQAGIWQSPGGRRVKGPSPHGAPFTHVSAGATGLKETVSACVIYTVPMYTVPLLEKVQVPVFKSSHSFPHSSCPGSPCCFQRGLSWEACPWERGMEGFTAALTRIQYLD